MVDGIISSALQLIKEKEKQGDKGQDRMEEQYRQQTYARVNADWTGTKHSSPAAVNIKVAEKKDEDETKTKKKSDTDTNAESALKPATTTDNNTEGEDNGILSYVNKFMNN